MQVVCRATYVRLLSIIYVLIVISGIRKGIVVSLTNLDRQRKKLASKYQDFFNKMFLAGFLIAMFVMAAGIMSISSFLGIDPDLPVRGQPHRVLFGVLSILWCLTAIFCGVGYFPVLATSLRFYLSGDMTREQMQNLLLMKTFPDNWLIDGNEK